MRPFKIEKRVKSEELSGHSLSLSPQNGSREGQLRLSSHQSGTTQTLTPLLLLPLSKVFLEKTN